MKTVIFDLDGTLLYTLRDLMEAGNYALAKNGLPTRSLEEFRDFVGNGIPRLAFRLIEPETSEVLWAKILADFRAYYSEHRVVYTEPYEGILPMLDRLRENGYTLGVVSNKDEAQVVPIIKGFFGERFSLLQGYREDLPPKPAPDMLLAAMASLGAKPEETVYVGDSGVDIEAALRAGVAPVAVLWGYRDREELIASGAALLAENPAELGQLLLDHPAFVDKNEKTGYNNVDLLPKEVLTMVFGKVQEIVNEKFDIDPAEVTMESNIRDDFDADSLDLVDMISEVEDAFEIRIPTEVLTEIVTVGDLVEYIEGQI